MALTIVAGGDVFNELPDGKKALARLSPALRRADVAFANNEGVYSDRPSPSPSRKVFHGADRSRGQMLADAGFAVMGVANNHSLDGGEVGLADTLEVLRDQGIATVGAGADLEEALAPALLRRADRDVAFLAFCSTFPIGYEARTDRPGLAPLRVNTMFRNPDPNFWEPGFEPEVVTQPDAGDLAHFQDAIRSARERADVVVVSCHWGYAPLLRGKITKSFPTHRREWLDGVQAYEEELAREAIECGADAVVCHHQLSLRGVRFHRGRPIFHGLGILLNHFDRPDVAAVMTSTGDGPSYPHFPFPAHFRMTGLALLQFDAGDVQAGFVPAMILPDGSTEPLAVGDPRADDVFGRLLELSEESGFEIESKPDSWGDWALLRLMPGSSDQPPERSREDER